MVKIIYHRHRTFQFSFHYVILIQRLSRMNRNFQNFFILKKNF